MDCKIAAWNVRSLGEKSRKKEVRNLIHNEKLNWSPFYLDKMPDEPNTSTLKKLDRVMGNGKFMEDFTQAYALFLPYLVSDHSLAILFIPQKQERKMKKLKYHLKNLSWKDGSVFKRADNLKVKLVDVQKKLDEDYHNNSLRTQATKVLNEYNEAI
ncbi:hypothetical protein Tco_0992893 [Tanacetum coccineum]|uniref:Uncharacterized protein n=1 Tax=Tanacetum coccineum TaxID=301880 RepID=A0ABQ5F3Y0_9ASTR